MFDGCSISELAAVFNKDKRTVSEKIRGIKPSGERYGVPIYHMREAARLLCDPISEADIEDYIKQLRPNDLPPMLLKEFWNGQLSKQKFELAEGALWQTDDVLRVLTETFKKLKTGVLLFADTIEAKTELTDKQRRIINELSDGLLVELHKTLVEDTDVDVSTGIAAEDLFDPEADPE